ncbi:MAG: 50S ribosomal protein L10 [Clostridia bacterium]|nr:50S ribosomal protein L10 [Clostridia bacterium]
MPNEKVLSEKKAVVAALTEKMKNASSGILVDYKGITVDEDTKLRAELRKNGVDYSVVKNTFLRFAADELGYSELDEHLNGTTALALGMEDPIAPTKFLCDFAAKKEKDGIFTVKGGFMEGKFVSADEIKKISKLGSKNTLVATVLGTMNAPIAAFARVINAIAEKQGAPAAAETTAE